VQQIFDLLTPKVDPALWTTCAKLQVYSFTKYVQKFGNEERNEGTSREYRI